MTLCSPTERSAKRLGRTRRAFTLVEVVISLAIMSILIVAMGSTIILASNALPSKETPAQHIIEATRGANSIADELRTAIHMTERSANAVTFTVADRNGDGIWERIRYAWSGATGDPVTRQYNNGSPAAVIADVHQFDLGYELTTVTEEYPSPVIESGEIELAEYAELKDQEDYKVKLADWIGQYIQPSLPEGTVSWSVTRVLFLAACRWPLDSTAWVQLRYAGADYKPTDTVLEQHMMYETNLELYYTWREFNFSNVVNLPASEPLCLVIKWASGNEMAYVLCDDKKDYGAWGRLKTTNAGDSWEFKDDKGMLYYVYGKVMTAAAQQTATRQYVTAVHITIQAGDSSDSRIETTVQTLNAPEALSEVWEADFNADPTLIDLNGDTIADWCVSNGTPFEVGQLVNGVFEAHLTLDTNPWCDFNELTTVDIRLRDTQDEGETGGVRLRIDRTGSTYGYIRAEVDRVADGTQTLTVRTYDPALSYVAVVTQTGLPPDDFIDLRLMVDPDLNTVNLRINGEDKGTYGYGRITAVTDRIIGLFETATISGVEFDHIRVRVGGNAP